MSGDTPTNADNMASPSYRLAALDQDFLLGDSMRGVRFLMEYAKAEEALRAWGVRSTIVVFGSARIGPEGGERHARWYEAARAFGRIASERGGARVGQPGQDQRGSRKPDEQAEAARCLQPGGPFERVGRGGGQQV